MSTYTEFLNNKVILAQSTGIQEIPELNSKLFPFQKALVEWALKRGRAAIFAECGLGKSFIQLEWAKHIPGNILILAPLAVSNQTVEEGNKFGIEVQYVRHQNEIKSRIVITNYEMLDHFDPDYFSGIVLDESSLLKSFDGKTKAKIIDMFKFTPYKLACTATPAPNDYMELGNHAEFLGIMSRIEMLSMFFVHDGGETQKWRLKKHAENAFWKWMVSWALYVKKPSDLGYSDDGYDLPKLTFHEHIASSDKVKEGTLFGSYSQTLSERITTRRETITDRVEICKNIVMEKGGKWIIWCHLNSESDLLEKLIPGSISIQGSDSPEIKIDRMMKFIHGDIDILISKPSILGFGINLQCCNQMAFVGLNDSWESFYQAVRRCWRFGQINPVDVHLISSSLECSTLDNLKQKEAKAEKMASSVIGHMKTLMINEVNSLTKENDSYTVTKGNLPSWV